MRSFPSLVDCLSVDMFSTPPSTATSTSTSLYTTKVSYVWSKNVILSRKWTPRLTALFLFANRLLIARSAASIQKEETAFKSSLVSLYSELASLWEVPEEGTPKSEDCLAPLQGWELQV